MYNKGLSCFLPENYWQACKEECHGSLPGILRGFKGGMSGGSSEFSAMKENQENSSGIFVLALLVRGVITFIFHSEPKYVIRLMSGLNKCRGTGVHQ